MGGAVSSGRDNNELIDNLVGGNYIRTASVERVFRALDRADYMTRLSRDQAYKDLAWRDGALHLSAPCIYSEVMEGLELKPGLSFLNMGSGTGYLSTLVGLVIGASGISHGVEIVPSVVEYANKRLGQFMANSATLDELDFCEPRFYCGNGLRLAPLAVGYDRVYCGAGCPDEYQNYFKQLIKVGGILIMPLNDSLLQIRRTSATEWTARSLLNVSFATLRVPAHDDRSDLLRLEEQTPPRLAVLSRSVIRTAMRETLRRKHPELREPPPRAPPAKRQCPRRICIPVDENESDDLSAGLDALHDLDRDAGGAEMNALLSLVLNMGTNRAAGSLRVLDTDGEDDEDDRDYDDDDERAHGRRDDRSDDQSSSESDVEAGAGAGAEAPAPARGRPWTLRNRDVIVFSIENNVRPEQDDPQPSRSHSPSPAPSSPRFGADEAIYPPEYPAHEDELNTDDEACECDDPTCLNYNKDKVQENTRVTRSQSKSMSTDTSSCKSTPDTKSKSDESIPETRSKSDSAKSTDSNTNTPKTRTSTKSENYDSSEPSSSKSVSDNSKSEKSSPETRSKPSKRTTSVLTRKPVTRSDSNKNKTEGKRIIRSTKSKLGKCSNSTSVDCNQSDGDKQSKAGSQCSTSTRDGADSPVPSEVEICLGNTARPGTGTSAMEWESEHNMDVEDDHTSDSETVTPQTSSRRKTDSGVGDEGPSPSPSSSSPPTTTTTSSSYTTMSPDDVTRGRRRRVKRRRNVASRSSSAEGSSTPAADADADADDAPSRPRAPAPAPRNTPGAIRVRLSTLMKRGVKELPLPYELKRYVNFYRMFQF